MTTQQSRPASAPETAASGSTEPTPTSARSDAGEAPVVSPVRAWTAVVALAFGVFSFVTAELVPVGLLPSIAGGVDVSVGTAGFLVTGFGLLAAVTAAPLTTLCGSIDRKVLMAGLLVFYVLGNVLASVAGSYAVLLLGRLVVALAHGVFWSIAAAIAVRLVPSRHAVRATSIVLSGISLAAVFGVPLDTVLGQHAGWRAAFLAVSAVGLLVLVALMLTMPNLPAQGHGRLGTLFRVLRNGRLRTAVAVTGLVMVGHFLAFTYITPFLETVTGIATGTVAVLLLVFGAAGIVGNFLGGALVNHTVRGALLGALGVMTVVMALLWAFGDFPGAAVTLVLLWGLAYAAIPVGLQTWILRLAKEESDAASSLYVAAFNGAIAVGSLIGGLIVDTPAGPRALVGIATALVAGALGVLLLSGRNRARAGTD
ncbi:MFS transporter [Saccharopolyspora sp. ID03-671]|uniref:MFS transporter n=1 Tax=Saccharopolyspora sp. ID03-671 TaxID=3073066 RepID=UPI00324DDFF7